MDERRRSGFISPHLFWILFFFFLISFIPSTDSLSPSPWLPLCLSFRLIYSFSLILFSLQGFHLDLHTPPPGATLITYGGGAEIGNVVSSQN